MLCKKTNSLAVERKRPIKEGTHRQEEDLHTTSTATKGSNNSNQDHDDSKFYKYYYHTICSLCIFMLFWILVIPSSALQDLYPHLPPQLLQMRHAMNKPQHDFLPRDLTQKFKGHYAVHFTHTLPAAAWAGIIPLQLHPTNFLRLYKKTTKQGQGQGQGQGRIQVKNVARHRILGYIFVSCVVLIASGVIIILQRGLSFANYDNSNDNDSNDNSNQCNKIDSKNPSQKNNTDWSTDMFLVAVTIWFVITAIIAVMHAKKKNILLHQKWMIRHIGAGIWVAIQRILIIITFPILGSFEYTVNNPTFVRRHFFGKAGLLGMLLSVLLSEWMILKLTIVSYSIRVKKQ